MFLVNGDLRLSGGHEGLLEAYNNEWGYVCGYTWNKVNSDLACRILGFKRAADFTVNNIHPDGTSSFSITDVQCTGNETNILDCSHGNNFCFYNEHIFLSCAVGMLTVWKIEFTLTGFIFETFLLTRWLWSLCTWFRRYNSL